MHFADAAAHTNTADRICVTRLWYGSLDLKDDATQAVLFRGDPFRTD